MHIVKKKLKKHIPHDRDDYNTIWACNYYISSGQIYLSPTCGNYAEANLTFEYTNIIWGTEDERLAFALRNIVMPGLEDLGVIKVTDEVLKEVEVI